tara:strand:+ start:3590 stop:4204 length:615 start_codon:yes stop_codon:yes gene_type:complete
MDDVEALQDYRYVKYWRKITIRSVDGTDNDFLMKTFINIEGLKFQLTDTINLWEDTLVADEAEERYEELNPKIDIRSRHINPMVIIRDHYNDEYRYFWKEKNVLTLHYPSIEVNPFFKCKWRFCCALQGPVQFYNEFTLPLLRMFRLYSSDVDTSVRKYKRAKLQDIGDSLEESGPSLYSSSSTESKSFKTIRKLMIKAMDVVK